MESCERLIWFLLLCIMAISHVQSHNENILSSEGCGTTKGCFKDPNTCTDSTDCDFFTSWTINEDGTKNMFVVGGKAAGYVALGFSKSVQKMDDSDVYACTQNNEVVRSRNGLSHANEHRTLKGVSHVEVSIVEGWLECSFTREAWIDDNDEDFYDLRKNNTYHIIMARFDSIGSDGHILYHQSTKRASANAVSFADFVGSEIGEDGLRYQQAHGSLMIIAWVGFASIGIVMARYFKPMWPNTKICGIAVWFLFHRMCMISCATCTIAAFIVIFIHTGEYFTPEQGTIRFLHALFGTIVTFLVILNPIMATFRPHPGEPKRPIFNWAHWAVGTLAFNLGMVTICFGLKGEENESLIDGLENADRLFWTMIAFFIFHAIMWILFEVQRCMTESQGRSNDIPLQGQDKGSATQLHSSRSDNYSPPPETTTIMLPPGFDIGFPSIHTIRKAGTMAKTVLLVIYVCGVIFVVSFIVIHIALVGT